MITKGKMLDSFQILPTNSVRKYIEVSLENLDADIGAYMVTVHDTIILNEILFYYLTSWF